MLCLVRTKACRRCGGDLSLECDIYGVYATCIQCGATWSKNDMIIQTDSKTEERLEVIKPKRLAVTGHGH